ncbi:lipase 1-like [Aethina tumida]|uniref:lipase 1-like n=1 Tax=Aethina tumida TaxID=116153 RepID=UPI002148FEAC|nr:lipase 1-like [Aethina tumida]
MVLLHLIAWCIIFKEVSSRDPLVGLKSTEIIEKAGYKAEEHVVTTEDGYILTHHRIPSRKNLSVVNKHPILLIPGTSATSECFLLIGNISLGFVLVDQGYDVWLLNLRGSFYGMNHTSLDPEEDKSFWDFSFHEYGFYDVAATIDYILNVTQVDKITTLGHSQGSTITFVTLASRPEYNKKIKLNVSFAPSCYLGGVKVILLQILAKHWQFLEHLVREVLNIQYVPTARGMLNGLDELCAYSKGFREICYGFVVTIDYGADVDKMFDENVIPALLSNMPGGVSTKNLFHYLQMYNTGNFSNYDYGPDENLKRYKSIYPEAYNVSQISTPCFLFYNPHDLILPQEGLKRLTDTLQQPTLYEIKDPNFRHLAFILSKYVVSIYPKFFEVLAMYNK